jgi:hypothetical protein
MVLAIEETRDLTKMTMDELHGTLTTYEMRTNTKNGHPNREEYFKYKKKTRNKEHGVDEKPGNESNEEEAYFVRSLKMGTDKYKGKLPFKCFNCGRIAHYAKKCHFEEKKIFQKKKSLYSKEDNNSSHENDGEEREVREVLFITQETQNDDHKNFETDKINYKEDCDARRNKHRIFLGKQRHHRK